MENLIIMGHWVEYSEGFCLNVTKNWSWTKRPPWPYLKKIKSNTPKDQTVSKSLNSIPEKSSDTVTRIQKYPALNKV